MSDKPVVTAELVKVEPAGDAPPAEGGAPGLPLPEFSFRAGLLLGAMLFLGESIGFPWSRNLFGLAGMVVAGLLVLTMAFQWRVLGDWRLRTQQGLYILFALALSMPLSATLKPSLGSSVLPDEVEGTVTRLLEVLGAVPGLGLALQFVAGFLSFIILLVILVVLVFGGRGGSRVGVGLVSGISMVVCLLLYPSIETVLGFGFLAGFVYTEWEIPLLLPDRVRRALSPVQCEYLVELLREGSLSTGETRLWFGEDAGAFGRMLDLQLVEYDSISRCVQPGARLRRDPAAGVVEVVFGAGRRIAWVLVGVIYLLLPDLIPGPIDDAIIMALCTLSGLDIFSFLRGRRTGRIPAGRL